MVAEEGLEEIETSRRIRATIQPYLTSMALFHPNPQYSSRVSFALTDRFGITGRYSALDTDNTTKVDEITFSPGFAINDNWLVLAEVRRNLDAETTVLAFESLVTF